MNINPKKEKASKDKGNADIDKVVEYFFLFLDNSLHAPYDAVPFTILIVSFWSRNTLTSIVCCLTI